jgi:hypothetical protein
VNSFGDDGFGIEAQIVGGRVLPPAAEPARPAQSLTATERQLRDLVLFEEQASVPIKFEAEIRPDPGDQLPERRTARQEALVLFESQRPEANPEFVLTVPHAAADDGASTERRPFRREKSPLPPAQRQPVANELLDVDGHAEKVLENVRQPFAVPDLPDQCAHVKQLGQVGQRVAIAKRRRRHSDERPDVDREAILLQAIPIDVRLRLSPGAVEEGEEPMMQDIEKPAEGRVARMLEALARVLREVNRERSVGAEETEEPDLEPRDLPRRRIVW